MFKKKNKNIILISDILKKYSDYAFLKINVVNDHYQLSFLLGFNGIFNESYIKEDFLTSIYYDNGMGLLKLNIFEEVIPECIYKEIQNSKHTFKDFCIKSKVCTREEENELQYILSNYVIGRLSDNKIYFIKKDII